MATTAAFPNVGREIREYAIATGQDFPEGAAVVLANGEIEECGADPVSILGFALHESGVDPDPTIVLVAIAKSKSTFWIAGTRVPLASDEGKEYGLAVDGDGDWVLDLTETVNTRAAVVSVDTTRNLYEISILPDNRQVG